jgi:predicted MFS family arabinose efflux permease
MKWVFQQYSNAYKGLAPSTWWLSLVMFINRSGTMVFPFMTLYMTTKLGYSISQAGWVMMLFGIGAVGGGFVGGKMVDRFGFYYVQIVTLIGGGCMFMVLGQMRSYGGICMMALLLSFINDMFRPANSSAIAHYSKEENRSRSFSLNRLAINLGWMFGGAMGGFIASKNYEMLFWIDGITNIVAAFMLWFFLAPSKNKATLQPRKEKSFLPSENTAYNDKAYRLFFLSTVLFGLCFFQLFTTLPVFYRKEMHFNELFIGELMALNGLMIALFEMVVVHSLEGKRNYLWYIMAGSAMVGLSFSVFNMLPDAGVWVAFLSVFLMTAGEMLSMPFMNTYWIGRTNEANRGQYAGLYTVSWSLAQVIGPGLGAHIADRFGFTILWWLVGALCVLTGIGYRMLDKVDQLCKKKIPEL